MKLSHEVCGPTVRASIAGDLEASSCTCLRNFWELRLAGHPEIVVDLDDADVGDGTGVAELSALVRDSAREGSQVTLHRAPQMVAHTLYKAGLLREGGGVTLVEPREEEPYG